MTCHCIEPLAALLLLGGCTADPTSLTAPTLATPPALTQAVTPSAPPHDVCGDRASVQAHYGKSCIVAGTYELRAFLDKGSHPIQRDWPIVVLDDGTQVMIESVWDEAKKPDAAAAQALRGKRVELAGELHSTPPKESPENFGFPCVSPIYGLRQVGP